MKKIITVVSILFYGVIYAQIPVTDVATNANLAALNVNTATSNTTLASQLTTAGNQLTQMEKSYEQIKKAAEKIENVSNMVKSVNNMEEIISLQNQAIKNIKVVMKNPNVNKSTLDNLNNALVSISANVNIISKLLSNGLFNMTDKERLEFFEDKRQRILIDVVKTRILRNKYQ